QVKSAFGRRIFRQDLLHIYEQKTEYRDALGRDAERTMAELIAQMETGQLQNENLEQPILELSRRLQNTKGKTVYGYLPPTAKALVDAIVDELAKEERVAAAYDLWNQMREEVCRTYSEQLPERLLLSKQKEFKAVRNMVVREVLQLGRGEHPTADEIVHMPTPSGTPPAQSGLPYGAHHPQQEAAHHQRTQTHRAVSHADTARCVLQLFHSMGRIFREQSASDAIQTGLHIDRKRRRMLREKRMALGHKADDHEEIPQHSQR
ncbi:relaxase MobL, partial [Flavonifractor plautii]